MTDAVAAFIGSVAVIFLVVHLVHGTGWLPYALMLAGLVGAHLCLRAVRYQKRRHARHSPRSRSLPSWSSCGRVSILRGAVLPTTNGTDSG